MKKKISFILNFLILLIIVGCSKDDAIEENKSNISPVLSNFEIPSKTIGDLPFNLSNPVSTSKGSFTFTSSNPQVASIIGNTVTIVGAGTTVIKAIQLADGNYTSGETSTNLIVNSTTPPTGLRTLYVATTGDDSNDGSANKPFLTINKAAQVAIAGDVVIIKKGTYTPSTSIVVTNSGTSTAPITFFAEVKDAVIIDGKSSLTPTAADRLGLFTILGTTAVTKNWIVIDGIRVINSKWAGIYSRYSDNITIKNCSTLNTGASGIIGANSSNIKVINNKVQQACMYPDPSQGTNECITMASVKTFEVAYNTVSDRLTDPSDGGEGIDVKNNSTNGTIHHNSITNLIRIGIYVDAYSGNLSNIEVYNNKIYSSKSGGITIASEQGGTVNGVKVFNNLIYDLDKFGIRIAGYLSDGPLNNLDIYQNTIVNCGTNNTLWEHVGLLLEAKNVTNTGFNIRNNIFSGCANQMRGNAQTFAYILDNNVVFGPTIISGTNAITSNPLFKNIANKDFGLTANSEARDKAVGTPLATKDFFDSSRDLKPDIGAIEYQ